MARLGRGAPDAEMRHVLDQLRARRFDLAVQCAGGGETTNAFVCALGARITAGQQWPDSPPLDVWMPYQRNQPDVLRLLDLMQLLGAPPGPVEYDLAVFAEDEAQLRDTPGLPLTELCDGKVIGVSAGAGSGARCWPPGRFAAVLDAVLEHYPDVHVVLTGTVAERGITSEIGRLVSSARRLHDLTGALSIGALLALISRLRLFLGNDSAPAHFATALGVPSVIVFGSAHPAQWAPVNRVWHRAVADETAPCRRFSPPCGCPDDATALCIDAVRVQHVLTQVEQVLELLAQTGKTHGASTERSGTVVGRS
jgi:ADP-heptose:LPS heptosyltransferase